MVSFYLIIFSVQYFFKQAAQLRLNSEKRGTEKIF